MGDQALVREDGWQNRELRIIDTTMVKNRNATIFCQTGCIPGTLSSIPHRFTKYYIVSIIAGRYLRYKDEFNAISELKHSHTNTHSYSKS